MATNNFVYSGTNLIVLEKWKVKTGCHIFANTVIFLYSEETKPEKKLKFKSTVDGTVQELLVVEGDVVKPGTALLKLQSCTHEVIMKDLCAQCGADLRQLSEQNLQQVVASRSFSLVHVVPELKCSFEQAEKLDLADETRLLKTRKLSLLVDLDHTLIHTTNEIVPVNIKDVFHFKLYGQASPWYHMRLRPGTQTFLENISKLYELHIFTFGARLYAHKVASILDPKGRLFSHRILSRDECFDSSSKTANLKSLFPRGDGMVCIIDDREDVWNFAPNVVHVKPYLFFSNTGDINAPGNKDFGRPLTNNSVFQYQNEQPPAVCDSVPPNDKSCPEKTSDEEPKEKGVIQPTVPVESPENENSESLTQQVDNLKVVPNDESSTENNDCNMDITDASKHVEQATDVMQNKPENEECSYKSREPSGMNKDSVPDIAESAVHNEDDDDYLLYLEEILNTIHKAFFEIYDQMSTEEKKSTPDLRNIIPYVRKKTLQGVTIVFSGVIPTNVPLEKSSLWVMAKSMGAEVTDDLVLDSSEKSTTHIIATRLGTSKLNRAKKATKIHIVTPNWLFCCAQRWEKVDERLFPLKKNTGTVEQLKPFTKSRKKNIEGMKARSRYMKRPCQVPNYTDLKEGKSCVSADVDKAEESVDSDCAELEHSGRKSTQTKRKYSTLLDDSAMYSSEEETPPPKRMDNKQEENDEMEEGQVNTSDNDMDSSFNNSRHSSSESMEGSLCSEDEKLAAELEFQLMNS